MRFTEAWAEASAQNVVLRVAIASLSLVLLGLIWMTAKISARGPIVVERACATQALKEASSNRTEVEIQAFLREALSIRFDSAVPARPGWLHASEEAYREQEQRELHNKEMSQRVLVNEISVRGSNATVETDRLISVGKLKTVIRFPIEVSVATTQRTEENPYGLLITRVKAIEEKNEKSGGTTR